MGCWEKAGCPAPLRSLGERLGGGGGEQRGGCCQQTESVFFLSSALFSQCPSLPPRPSSCGRWQWMLRSQTKHAGLLFGGGRLSAPLAPCQKHVQPSALCLREVLFSFSPPSFFPLPSPKTLFVAFPPRAPPSRYRGARVRVVFPTWGQQSGAARNSERRDPPPAGNPLFPAAWGWGVWREGGVSNPIRAPGRLVLLKVAAFPFPFFYPLKQQKTKYGVSTQLGLKGGRLPPSLPPRKTKSL